METYRAAVIGLTGIGGGKLVPAADPVLGHHAPHSHVSAYASVPRTTLVAVCDLLPERLEQFRTTWGDTFPEATTYTDYREMLAKEQIDLLSVVTGDNAHTQMVLDGVAAGVKGIFCEKPIATRLSDADRMIEACRAQHVPLLIDHSMRWWADYVEARALIRSGAIGQVQRVMVTGCGPRAMLFRNTTHVLDMLNFLIDAEPEWVSGELDDQWADYPPRYAGDGGKKPETDPGATAVIHYKNGIRALVNCSQVPVSYREWDVLGDKGRLRVGFLANELWRKMDDGSMLMSPLRAKATTRADMAAAIHELIDLIEHGGTGSSTGEDARRTLSLLLGILQSNAAGGARISFPVQDK